MSAATGAETEVEAATVLGVLPDPVLVISESNAIQYVNPAAEQFFKMGAAIMSGMRIDELVAPDSPLVSLVAQVRKTGVAIREYDAEFGSARTGQHSLHLQVTAFGGSSKQTLVTFQESAITARLDQGLTHRAAARSVTGMAAILAHEVKNPLSGIRGAAQLLEQNARGDDRDLARLIRDEADRIVGLVDRMELFSDERPLDRAPVNIHEVLEHVRRIGQAGFGRDITFHESYDPSLPLVPGNRGQLVQVILNLVKNAAEAMPQLGQEAEPDFGGQIRFSTAYRQGLRLSVPGQANAGRVHLPLEVVIEDNGSGVPQDIQSSIFDPFVTSKSTGTGLGLSLVAKIIGDHGGVIECESAPRKTVFRIRLPILTEIIDKDQGLAMDQKT